MPWVLANFPMQGGPDDLGAAEVALTGSDRHQHPSDRSDQRSLRTLLTSQSGDFVSSRFDSAEDRPEARTEQPKK